MPKGLFLGVLGRAQELYDFPLFAYACLGTHYSMLIGVRSAEHMSAIMAHVHANVAKEIGRENDWPGRFWDRRGAAILCLDDANIVDRLSYVLSNSVKENAVEYAMHWPGPHAAKAFATGKRERGFWINREALFQKRKVAKARKEKKLPTEDDARTDYEIKLAKLPCWRDLSDKAYVVRVREMMNAHAKDAKLERARTGKRVQGIKSILAQDPHERPAARATSPAPFVHCVKEKVKAQFKKAYRAFVGAYREALVALYAGVEEACFPEGGIPPGSRWLPEPGG